MPRGSPSPSPPRPAGALLELGERGTPRASGEGVRPPLPSPWPRLPLLAAALAPSPLGVVVPGEALLRPMEHASRALVRGEVCGAGCAGRASGRRRSPCAAPPVLPPTSTPAAQTRWRLRKTTREPIAHAGPSNSTGVSRARELLTTACDRVLSGETGDNCARDEQKDRSLAGQVRVEILAALAALRKQ